MNIKILRNLAIFMALNCLILPNSEAMTENMDVLELGTELESEIQEEKSDKKKILINLKKKDQKTENILELDTKLEYETTGEKSDKKKTFYKNPKVLVPVGLFGLTVFGLYYHRNSIFGDRNRSKVKNGTANLKVKDEIKNSK